MTLNIADSVLLFVAILFCCSFNILIFRLCETSDIGDLFHLYLEKLIILAFGW